MLNGNEKNNASRTWRKFILLLIIYFLEIKEATIKKWHVKVGDKVEEFDGLCDVVTDKLFTTIPSSYSGTILAIHHKEESIC